MIHGVPVQDPVLYWGPSRPALDRRRILSRPAIDAVKLSCGHFMILLPAEPDRATYACRRCLFDIEQVLRKDHP